MEDILALEERINRLIVSHELTRAEAIDYAIEVAQEGLEMALADDMQGYIEHYQKRIDYYKSLK